jgi:hemoglobin-like flavoprotein
MAERTAPDGLAMTPHQRRLVVQSCELLREQAGPVSLLFYGTLFELDPSTRRLFYSDLAAQGQKLIDTLGAITMSLEQFDSMRPRLAELGRQHADYGVLPRHYESVIQALLWALGHALGADFDAPTREAWQGALAAISAAMQMGSQSAVASAEAT